VSLQFNVSSLLKEPTGSIRDYDVEGRALVNEDGPDVRDVSGCVKFLRTNEGILVTASLHGIEHESCSRCLKPIETGVDLEFQEMYYPVSDIVTGVRLPEPEDPEAFRIDSRHVLDLEEAIRQFWTVARVMQPLCRADCKGLCPQCGQDWNDRGCDCAPAADERWSALGTLLRK